MTSRAPNVPAHTPETAGDDRRVARLLSALDATHWNKSQAASQLSWSRMTLYRKMQKYELHPPGQRAKAAG